MGHTSVASTSTVDTNVSTQNSDVSATTAINARNISSASTSTSSTWTHAQQDTTPLSSEPAAEAIAALLNGSTSDFFQTVSSVGALAGHVIQDLVVAAEHVWSSNESSNVDAETAVDVLTAIGDVASAGLAENEERSYETPGGTVLQVMAPSNERVSSGFVLGPFTIPPLFDMQNITVQVISWATNLFDLDDVSDTVLTINVRRGNEDVALENLASPLQFRLQVSERMTHSGVDTFSRTCVFWNTTSGNWSGHGLHVVRANLTQVMCESSHATSFAVRYATTSACPFCARAPSDFFALDMKLSSAMWTWIAIGVSTCLHLAWLHTQDRRDWIPPHQNLDAYFRPRRPRRRTNRTMLAAMRRFVRNQLTNFGSPLPAPR